MIPRCRRFPSFQLFNHHVPNRHQGDTPILSIDYRFPEGHGEGLAGNVGFLNKFLVKRTNHREDQRPPHLTPHRRPSYEERSAHVAMHLCPVLSRDPSVKSGTCHKGGVLER